VADRLGIPIAAIAAGRPSRGLAQLADRYPDARVACGSPPDPDADPSLAGRFDVGPDAVVEVAATPGTIVVNGIVGSAGLAASLAALEAGNRLALANKESLISGGPLVAAALESGSGELVPVDSEHSAIWQCLIGEDISRVRRVILTASGGPFRGRNATQLAAVTVAEALAHPTWAMGRRISIDSATLMNKAFEVIEAHFLFGLDFDRIDVVVHPQSFVHSFVEFVDGVVKAEVGPPDMRKPIQFAITEPVRQPAPVPALDLVGVTLSFEEPDRETFPALDLGYAAGRRGGNAPAVLNAADEVAVEAFLHERIPFPAIADVVAQALESVPHRALDNIEDVLESDRLGRAAATRAVDGMPPG
jgi:1-deoxy-D-xylulose-5-phosphate reductoisomerase